MSVGAGGEAGQTAWNIFVCRLPTLSARAQRPEHYLSHPAFECIGSLSEVMA